MTCYKQNIEGRTLLTTLRWTPSIT